MRKLAIPYSSLVWILFSVLFIISCGKKDTIKKIDPAFAEYIESYTTGTISKASTIQIKLAPGIAPTHAVNEVISENILNLSPSVKGQTVWLDDRTLEFRPEKALDSDQMYEVQLQLSKITKVPQNLSTFVFNVKTLEPAFSFEQDGLIVDGASNTYMTLSGKILTADQEDSSSVQKILKAQLGNQDLKIKWTHDVTGRSHGYQISQIQRAKTSNKLVLNWNGSPIKSKNEDQISLEVPAIGDFKVLNIKSINHSDHYAVIQFSEPIKGANDLRGLITTSPSTELAFTVQGSEIFCYPPSETWGDFTINVHPGIENIWNEKLALKYTSSIHFEDNQPSVKILGKGEIVPTTGKIILPFEAVNLKAVDLTIIKIFENNIPQFFQSNQYHEDNLLRRVAKPLLQKTISLEDAGLNLNKKNRFSFELDEFFRAEPGAMYRVVITFKPEYSLFNCKNASDENGDDDHDYYYDDYYGYIEHMDDDGKFWSEYDDYFPFGYSWEQRDNPCHPSFYNKERWDARNIIASNIGLVAKRGNDKSMLVFTSNLITAEPLTNVDIEVLSYQQQPIFKGKTDNTGFLQFQCPEKPFLLIAKSGNEKNYLKLDDGSSQLLSRFDIDGTESTNGIKGMIYGDRGVWRPGDSLFINFILEDKGQIIPDDIPVEFNLYTPQGQLFKKSVTKLNVSGIYSFKTATFPASPTGNWNVKVKVGGASFDKRVKIETIMPNRLKINLGLAENKVIQHGSSPSITLSSMWLFGAPAQNLKSKVDVTFVKLSDPFPSYKGYVFEDPTTYFQSANKTVFEGTLNSEGKTTFSPDLKIDERAPGMLKASFLIKVFEPGGAFSTDYSTVNYSPYTSYIGINVPKGDDSWDYLETGKKYLIPTVVVNGNGQLNTSSTNVKATLYKLEWRWWWDETGGEANYVSNNYSNLVSNQTYTIENGKGSIPVSVDKDAWGRYLLLVEDVKSGHSTGQIIYFDDPYWKTRSRTDDPNSETLLAFTSDKEEYQVNETIRLNIPSSETGKLLISIENGSRVIEKYWVDAKAGQTDFQFKATSQMAPNVYAHISLIQPHHQTVNDRPIRMYGILPLNIKDPSTILQPKISVPEVVRPEKTFSVKVSENKGQAMAYSLVIVDEGLLDITRFKTPNPHAHFYAKEALGVKTWDVFDHVMGSFGGKYGRILSIGGDEALINNANANKAHRFPPIVKYVGTFELPKGQSREHSITLPPYFGSVKVMVVAAKDAKYGSADKSITVRNPLMVQTTAPRVVGPQEDLQIPVTVFATENSVKNVQISIQSSPHIQIANNSQQITFSKSGEQTIFFQGKVSSKTGIAQINVKATSNGITTSDKIELDVRNPNPMTTNVVSENLSAKEKKSFAVKAIGVPAQSSAVMEISSLPPLQLKKRLGYLIQYPHGCLEQITSTAFTQLYLNRLTELNKNQIADIEKNIKATIVRLKGYQQSDGSFSYWPGNNTSNDWASTYAGHFLLEAKSLGYHVPEEMLNAWLIYTKNKADKWSIPSQSSAIYAQEMMQVYRLYVLSVAGSPLMGAMNRLKEFPYLTDESKWRLAVTYQKAGQSKTAESLIKGLSTSLTYKSDQGYTFGSPIRNKAILLEILTALGKKQEAKKVMEEIAYALSSEQWMSTQTTAYSLLAIAKYSSVGASIPTVKASVKVNGKEIPFTAGKFSTQIPIDISKGKAQIEVANQQESLLYVKVITEGQPLPNEQTLTSTSSNLLIQTDYFDLNGTPLSVQNLPKGKDFVARVRVSHPGKLPTYQNLALSTIFPSGWEIINTRIWDAEQNQFTSSPYIYQDVRDDRVYTYFDLVSGRTNTYFFMLNAAYAGKYYQPFIQAEAMYDHTIVARQAGQWVEIRPE